MVGWAKAGKSSTQKCQKVGREYVIVPQEPGIFGSFSGEEILFV